MRALRSAAAIACIALLFALAAPGRADGPPPGTGGATLVVLVEGLKDDAGSVHAALHAPEDGFPTRAEKALRQADAPIQGGHARIVFEGIPTEGLAASNDAKGFMGPPSFEKARVEVGPGETRITVRISY